MRKIIGSHFVSGFEGTTLNSNLKKLIRDYHISGVILFSRNIESPAQVRELTSSIIKFANRPFLIGIDQEGGLVARLREPFTIIPPMSELGKYFSKSKDRKLILQIGQLMAKELKAVGVNWDFTPVVDVHSNPLNPIIGSRSFHPSPIFVSQCAEALIDGFEKEKVLTCAKHFPGHGATLTDSHLTLPVVENSGRLLWRRDLYPYRHLISKEKIKTLMTAHVLFPDLDEKNCATFSKRILINLLRGRLKYKGLIVSDDMFMNAVSDEYDLAQASDLFFRSGGDISLACRHPQIQIETIDRLEKIYNKDKEMISKLKEGSHFLRKIINRYGNHKSLPPLSTIGTIEHRRILDRLKI